MAKKVAGFIKLQIPAGKATPAPPVGPALGQHGVNIMGFCKEFNERTAKDAGLIIPVVITVYADHSFSFITKTPPAAVLIKRALNLESGSGRPNRDKVATITRAQLEEAQALLLFSPREGLACTNPIVLHLYDGERVLQRNGVTFGLPPKLEGELEENCSREQVLSALLTAGILQNDQIPVLEVDKAEKSYYNADTMTNIE